jgi:hypothetical protein
MEKPKIDQKLTLLTNFGETEAICAEVLENPATPDGVLLKVMADGPFQERQQSIFKQTIDSDVTLSAVFPA